jgi:hypothetical protein
VSWVEQRHAQRLRKQEARLLATIHMEHIGKRAEDTRKIAWAGQPAPLRARFGARR